MTTSIKGKGKQMVHEISLVNIEADADLQPRSQIDMAVVSEYADAMLDGEEFPPIVLFYDGIRYWLSDGFHRYKAAIKAKLPAIRAHVYQGGKDDALLYSVGANSTHGMRRTLADKRRAIVTMLNHPEWHRWTNAEIARRCHVGSDLVQRHREGRPDLLGHKVTLRVGGDGSLYDTTRLNTANGVHPTPAEKSSASFEVPNTPLTKQELTDTYARRVIKAVRAIDGGAQANVKSPFGVVEIVSDCAIYIFINVFERNNIYTAIGRCLLVSRSIGRDRMVVVGTFPRAVRSLIAESEALIEGLTFRTPEAIIADAEAM